MICRRAVGRLLLSPRAAAAAAADRGLHALGAAAVAPPRPADAGPPASSAPPPAAAARPAAGRRWASPSGGGAAAPPPAPPAPLPPHGGVAREFITVGLDPADGVVLLTLARPAARNALSSAVMAEVLAALAALDADPAARAVVVTGAGAAFAAGADIKEMAGLTAAEAESRRLLAGWDAIRGVRLPLVAAVNGPALGGGCELAMMCDVVLAADTAVFGQPEVALGVTPGMGATQRLARAVGKSRAMELVLGGGRFTAAEAAAWGLISRAVPAERLLPEARALAARIGGYSRPVVAAAKACVAAAFEVGLGEGLAVEHRAFWGCFGLADQKEGMAAFLEKRAPRWVDG